MTLRLKLCEKKGWMYPVKIFTGQSRWSSWWDNALKLQRSLVRTPTSNMPVVRPPPKKKSFGKYLRIKCYYTSVYMGKTKINILYPWFKFPSNKKISCLPRKMSQNDRSSTPGHCCHYLALQTAEYDWGCCCPVSRLV